jgi:uncharacterized protein YodC (DUF2158 family)
VDEIKAGDVVMLKSGGPKMPVSEIGKDSLGNMRVWCDWFEGSKMEQGVFPIHSLKLISS